MSKLFLYDTYKIPTYALGIIFNSDYSGLDDAEIDKVNGFIAKLPYYGNWEYAEDWRKSYFSDSSSIDSYGSDVVNLNYYAPKKPSWTEELEWINALVSECKSCIGYKYDLEYLSLISKEHQCHKKSATSKIYSLYYLFYFADKYYGYKREGKDGEQYLFSLFQCLHHTKGCALYGFSLGLDFKDNLERIFLKYCEYPIYPRLEYLVSKVTERPMQHYLNY